MIKKIFLALFAVILIFTTTTSVLPNNNHVEAATKCTNPYKGSLKKYNPCVTHTTVKYIYVKKNTSGTPIALTAAGVTTTGVNKLLTTLGTKSIPVVGGVVWASDAVSVAQHYINKSWKKKGIKRFKVTYKWKYQLDPLADGGGIPKAKVISTSTVAQY
ncbi:hypothetical protein DTX80_18030 [Bacilli bacterium]|nr:hypothetical protein WH51_11765 [Bacilli bacterium VT-13-104]PZD81390.1 hypothetical protein DEJ64_17530 [Bacilli bacterium]HAJ4038261.1 hypothetical protein [Escherichia coli]PZD83212.1 hypothetical protein DEJ60_17575 [Bacilli bacterium]PZD84690.1 hypothetical protein DEJ66_17540 [Bacilli bacterium]